jgi:signal transduction histidine kinase
MFSLGAQPLPVLKIDTATLSTQAGSGIVTLPHQFDSSELAQVGERVRYQLSVQIPQLPAKQWGIYVPKISMAGRISLNGKPVGQCEWGQLEKVRCINRPYLFIPPSEYWQEGVNHIQVELWATPQEVSGLSALHIGDVEVLQQRYWKTAAFWLVDFNASQMWVSLLLGILSLTIAYLLKDSYLYLWVGLSCLVGSLALSTILATHHWVSVEFFVWLGYVSRFIDVPLVCLAILGVFAQSRLYPWLRWLMPGYALLASAMMWWLGISPMLVSVFYAPMIVAALLLFVCVVRWSWKSPTLPYVSVTLVFACLIALGVIDWIRFNASSVMASPLPFLVPYGQSLIGIVFFVALTAKMAYSFRLPRDNELHLMTQVDEQAQALNQSQEKISAMERTLLKLTEGIPVGTYVLETDAEQNARFTFVSDRWLKMLNLQRDEVLADPSKGFLCVHPDEYETFLALNRRVFANIEPFRWEGRILIDNQVRWVSVESVPRKLSHGGAAWEGVMIDITANKESEAALKVAHQKLTENQAERAAMEERERLLQDMHDGFGSQLSTACIMAEQSELSRQQLLQVLQECLQDLHLVVNTLGSKDKTLEVVLAEFRFRTLRRISALPVQIHWSIQLAGLPALSERVILQICRILQEALTNALKHSQADNIWIDAMYLVGPEK